MMTLLYLLLLPMLSGLGMLGLGPALMAGRAGAAHVVLLLSGLLLPLRGLMYHFSRQFKDKFGMSPSEYAKSIQSE